MRVSGENGMIPALLNPAQIVCGEHVLSQALEKCSLKFNLVMTLPGND